MIDGARRFKRKALWLCGERATKTLDEMARLLYETGIASSIEEGREITPSLDGKGVYLKFGGDSLNFKKVTTTYGEEVYRIEIHILHNSHRNYNFQNILGEKHLGSEQLFKFPNE